jgi:hypothetical protein
VANGTDNADARATRSAFEGLPTTTIPEQTFQTPIAYAQVHPVRAIEAALRESEGKRPSVGALLVSLASPAALVAKGVQDLYRCIPSKVVATHGQATFAVDHGGLVIAIGCIAVGGVAFGVLLSQWSRARAKSELQRWAKVHVSDWLREMGQEPLKEDSVQT